MTCPRERRRERDAGAAAVVVALVVTLVLLPVAALAVDLGSSYTVAAALQRAADAASVAGAEELARQQRLVPAVSQSAAIAAATAVAVDVLCHDPTLNHGPPDPTGVPRGAWYGRCTGSGRGWASDRDTADDDPTAHPNGEIEFYAGSPSLSTGSYATSQRVDGSTAALVSGIRVVTPPATVRYGFAALFGRAAGTLQRAASAELLTVLPARDYNWQTGRGTNTRLYLTRADLVPQGGGGPTAWCSRSAPRESWQISWSAESNHPTGVCDPASHPSVPRGLLAASAATTPLTPNLTAQLPLEDQVWPAVSRMRELTPGLFGARGRLIGSSCGSSASTGGYSGVESAFLADFVNTQVGSAAALKTFVLSGAAPGPGQEGWLAPDILRCGRLAVVPVLSSVQAPPPTLGLTSGSSAVSAVRLVWLDNVFSDGDAAPIASTTSPTGLKCFQRGFYWENAYTVGYCPPQDDVNGPLRAVTGYLLDPRLLPATVSGRAAANAAPYVGSGLPATVRLLPDVSDPPPARSGDSPVRTAG
ncbi:MAG TPA: pilus assembly protein TadG-related protein [Kineosporiaceae bacterium]